MIETLESRIAPAGVVTISADGRTATWDDIDGDRAVLRVTKGQLTEALFTTDQSPANGLLVTKVDLTAPAFKGTALTVTALRDPLGGGNNSVDIGYVDATGLPLGRVQINGDLGRIDAGDPNVGAKTPKAIATMTVFSMGMQAGENLPAGVTQTSEIVGKLGPVKVRGSVQGILLNVTGGDFGSIDSLTITGSLIGTSDADSGRISATGKIGPVNIIGSIFGGDGQHSGSIEAGGSITSLKVGGSIFGGRSEDPSTDGTGVVRSQQSIGAINVVGSIMGGTQQDSGLIAAAGNMGAVRIMGGIVGGSAGSSSGGIFAEGNVGSVYVKGDVVGGAALNSGVIEIGGRSGAITLVGALTGGAGEGSGVLRIGTDLSDLTPNITVSRDIQGGSGEDSGMVEVNGKLNALSLRGSLRGGEGEGSGSLRLNNGASAVIVAGDVLGGAGEASGQIGAEAIVKSVMIGGSIIGGEANGAGAVVTSDAIERLTLVGSLIGGNQPNSATADLVGSGFIEAGRLGAVSIGGSLRVGQDYSGLFDLVNSAAIRVANNIGTLAIKGGVEGTDETIAVITARGQALVGLDQTTDVAITNIQIGGSVRNAAILAGYDTTPDVRLAEANPNAQIGAVVVRGDWIASDLVAGAAWNENFGDGSDVKSAGVDNPDIPSLIQSIVVSGQVVGTAADPTDRFAFVAQIIGSMSVGTAPTTAVLQLNAGLGNDNDPVSRRYGLANTGDVRVFEVS